MFKVGDYVVYSNVIHKVLSVATAGYLGLQDARKTLPPRLVKHPDIHSIHKPIRPAVLSDWAKEIPDIGVATMVDIGDGLIDIHVTKDIVNTYCLEKWIADALSAHYGISIMPYEQYKKYMEGEND